MQLFSLLDLFVGAVTLMRSVHGLQSFDSSAWQICWGVVCKNGIGSRCNLRNTNWIYDSLHVCFCPWHGWEIMKPWPLLLVYCGPVRLLLISIALFNSSFSSQQMTLSVWIRNRNTPALNQWPALVRLQGQGHRAMRGMTGKAASCPDSVDVVRCADVEHDLGHIPASLHGAHYLP